MAIDPIASRYAEALFGSAKADNQLDLVQEQLSAIGALIREHVHLRELLLNPDVDPDDKVGVLQRTLRADWAPLMAGFMRLVVARYRAEYLPGIADAYQALLDTERGRLHVTVRSARPLDEPALARLRARLAVREGKQIELATEVDPALLGGLQIVLGQRVIDGSVASQLHELRQRLTSIKVT